MELANIIELIKSTLESSGADAWMITDTLTEGWEFYFIRHRLDQNRAKNVEHIEVKVFKKSEDGAFLGDASDEIAPSADESGIKKTIDALVLKAAYVKNPKRAKCRGTRNSIQLISPQIL